MNQELINHFNDHLGWFLLKNWGIIRVKGTDNVSFLQSLVSNDLLRLKVGEISKAALLEKNSKVIGTFWVSKGNKESQLFIQKDRLKQIIDKLEHFIFAEDVQITEEKKELIYLQGPQLPNLFSSLRLPIYQQNTSTQVDLNSRLGIEKIFCINLTANEGAVFVLSKDAKSFIKKLDPDIREIDEQTWEILRVEAGLTIMGADFNEKNLLLEVDPLNEMVSTTKGCYPGQETIARTLSRGSVQKKIFGIKHQDKKLKTGDTLFFRGEKVAEIKSTIYSNQLNSFLSIAFLKRDFWFCGKEYRFEKIAGDFKSRIPVTIERLPFCLGKNLSQVCKSYLERGMNAYHKNNYEEAKELICEALNIHPHFTDAVEVLAVIAEKLGNIEEAISLNKQFAQLDANAVMAPANLSRLYLTKGWIEKAEEEKKKATLLGYKLEKFTSGSQTIRELTLKHQEENIKKIKMFQEILKMDPLDEIANFSLGKIYHEQKEHQKAKNCLKIVIKNNKNYSAAYNILGKTLIALDEKKEAISIFTQGIEVADEQGHLAPQKSMKEQLMKLIKETTTQTHHPYTH